MCAAAPATASAATTAPAAGTVVLVALVAVLTVVLVLVVLLFVGLLRRLGGGEGRSLDLGLDLVAEIVGGVGLGVGGEVVAATELAQLGG